jgi:hypothetical protein
MFRAILASFSSYSLIYYIWGGALTKIFALPISIIFFVSKRREFIIAAAISAVLVAIYFSNHGYSGTHDLKAALLFLSFAVPATTCFWATRETHARGTDVFYTFIGFITVNLVFGDQAFTINSINDLDYRYRGFVLATLITLLLTTCQVSNLRFFILCIFSSILIFIISGHRGASVIMLMSLSAMLVARILRQDKFLFIIPLVYLAYPLGVVAYEHFFPDNINNIIIRALSVKVAIETLSPFGNGMALPVIEFHQTGNFSHYFVPADIMYLGGIYELGYISFLAKAIFMYWLIRRYWNSANRSVIMVICSAALLGYNLTYDGFELAASAAAFKFLSYKK